MESYCITIAAGETLADQRWNAGEAVTVAALPAFRLDAAPQIGMRASASHCSFQAWDRPKVSLPITSATGPVRSISCKFRVPLALVPTIKGRQG